MRRRWIFSVLAVTMLWLSGTARLGAAQSCQGDLDDDSVITEADLQSVLAMMFVVDPDPRADVNGDGVVNAADLSAVVSLLGPCATATPTPSPSVTSTPSIFATSTPTPLTPVATGTATRTSSVTRTPSATPTGPSPTPTITRTRTVTLTPTRTNTPHPSTTPTPVCTTSVAQLGATNGELVVNDCPRMIGDVVRPTDIYTFVGTPGAQVTISVTTPGGSAPIQPFVVLIDGDGQFTRFQDTPPIAFVVTTSHPYEIWVASSDSSSVQTGPYTLTLTSMPCPTPRAISIPFAGSFTLEGTECTDPSEPTAHDTGLPSDQFTFSVSQVPMNLEIDMQQKVDTDSIDPAFFVIGPDGYEIVTPDDDGDLGGGIDGVDAQARFMALRTGTYTIIANGGGGIGAYQLLVRTQASQPINLTNIPADHPLVCPGQPGPGCTGTLYGDTTRTQWAAPLPIPGISEDTPELDAPADVYTFTTTNPGEVISVTMESSDDAHLYLLGPASAGNPLVAQDDDSGPVSGTLNAQLAATLVVAGKYTLVAVNNAMLQPPDPTEPGDTGEVLDYTLFIQKCPVQGGLNPATGFDMESTFSTSDCVGFGGVPFRTYSFNGRAGQFVSTSMSSEDVDAFVRVYAPDGTRIENDNDLFNPLTSDARANRLLPVDGTYYVEASSSVDQGEVDLLSTPAFTLAATSCATATAAPGTFTGTWGDADCTLASGQKFDVYTVGGQGNPPQAVSVAPPPNGCVVALLAEGPQLPSGGCSSDVTEFPVVSGAPYGFIIAGGDATTRGGYTARLSSCPLSTIGYGDVRTGALTASSCLDAAGFGADWFLVRAPAALTQFNDGVSGEVVASFPQGDVFADLVGRMQFSGFFGDDPAVMFPIGNDLATLVKITGSSSGARGSYTLTIDPALVRQ